MKQISHRIEFLRKKMLEVGHERHRVRRPLTILNDQNRDLPLVVRKALALDLILKEMPVFIDDMEVIVGSRTMFMPRETETNYWDEDVKRNLDFVPDAETLDVDSPGLEFYPHYATDEEKAAARQHDIGEGYVTSHCTAGYGNVLNLGFGGIKQQAADKLKEVSTATEQSDFLRAVIIVMDAATNLVNRYEEEANRLRSEISNANRRKDLEKIAAVCNKIKTEPAGSFHEALQLLWFAHTMILIESYNLMALGRLDQYLLPFYAKDIQKEEINPDEALELLSCFFIKLNDTSDLHTDNGLNIILSGSRPDGSDGTNDLTYLCFDAYENVRLTDPQINVRFHAHTPPKVIERANDMEKLGPRPMLYNDDTIIKAMQNVGVSLEDARNYCIDACQDLMIEGKSDFYPIFAGIYGIHLLTILERIVDRLPEYETFERFYQNLKDEITRDVDQYVAKTNSADKILPQISPTPFLSATLDGCIRNRPG